MKWFSTRCYNGGKQHNFSARYTQQALTPGDDIATVWQSMHPQERPRVYVCDVCAWCGAQVKPPGKG